MYRTVKKIADVCGLGAGYSAGVILALMGTVITFEVIARRAGHPTIWSFEFTKYFFLWSMLIGAAYTQQQDAHVRMEMIAELLPKRIQIFLELLGIGVGMVYTFIVLWTGLNYTIRSYTLHELSNSPLRTPLFIVYLGMPIGAGFIFLELICSFILSSHKIKKIN